MLAAVTVSNATDVSNANTSSVSALIANDGGDGISLREAITAANNTAGIDTVSFDGGVFSGGANSVIRLTQGELNITESVTIDGSAGTDVTITGDALGNDSVVPGTFVTDVAASGDDLSDNSRVILFSDGIGSVLTLESLTVTGGRTDVDASTGSGGGIFASGGDVSLIGSTVSGNTTAGDSSPGGGIFAYVNLSAIDSTVSGNSTSGAYAFGGGIFSPNVSLTSSLVSGNSTSAYGSDGGGIYASGDTVLINSTVSGNSALITGEFSGYLRGGGLFVADLVLNNSTVTGNTAGFTGGGIQTRVAASPIEVSNSIVAGNIGSGPDIRFLGENDPNPEILVVENSLIGDVARSGITAATGTGNILGQPALLGPLADNGGPTLTHALLSGSPAINAGSNALAVDGDGSPLTTDQRGTGFDRILGDSVDIGAFEADPSAASIPTVLSATIDEGGVLARPDLWNTLAVVFDSAVTVSAGDLSLFNDSTGGGSVDLSGIGFNFDSSTNTATWDFSSLAAPLDAAFYTYQLDASSITAGGLSLDGNGDGTAGDNFVSQHYVAIPGDANLDGVVNVLGDALALVLNLNSTTELAWADGNFNGDGVVDVLGDALTLVLNLNSDVRPAATVLASASGSAVTTNVVATSSGDADEGDAASVGAKTVSQSPSLVLSGDQELRDDVFGSDF